MSKRTLVWCITDKYPDEYFSIHTEYNHDEFEKAKSDLIKYSKESDYDFEEPMYLSEMIRCEISEFFPSDVKIHDNLIEFIEENIAEYVGEFELDDTDKKKISEILNKAIEEIKKRQIFKQYVYSVNSDKNEHPIFTVDEKTRELV